MDAARVAPAARLSAVVDRPRVVQVELVHFKVFVGLLEDVHQIQLQRHPIGCTQHFHAVAVVVAVVVVDVAAEAAQNIAIPNQQRVKVPLYNNIIYQNLEQN